MLYNILFVDDNKEYQQEFCAFFNDYNIINASNGEEALTILKNPNLIDLVILDEKMPGLKGTKILKEIKRLSPDLYTIILTGYSSEQTAIDAIKGHADDYLEKSIGIKKLKVIIDELFIDKNYKKDLDIDDAKAKVEIVKKFLNRNYNKILNLNDISEIIFLSPKYISRIFKEYTGVNFNQYRLNIKIQYAQELLRNTTYNIDQISYKLGYKNAESFIRIFKKIEKCTPSEYRKKYNYEKNN